jgi:pentatricopeptide repeat protein
MKTLGFAPSRYTFDLMLNNFGTQGLVDDVFNLFETMRHYKIQPGLNSYNVLLEVYSIMEGNTFENVLISQFFVNIRRREVGVYNGNDQKSRNIS